MRLTHLWETKEALAVVHDDIVMTNTKEGSSSIDMTYASEKTHAYSYTVQYRVVAHGGRGM